jgi:four helix bundle protein
MNKFDLEERLINFSVIIIQIVETLPNTRSANHSASQLIRSGTSPALNYGEAQSAESKKDFIHKLKISLKEFRETYISMKIIDRAKLYKTQDNLKIALTENNELISIFVESIETAIKNAKK